MGKEKVRTGLTLGIIGTALGVMSEFFAVAALPVSIVGLVLSVTGRRELLEKGLPAGIGTAGLVLGIIGVVFSSLNILYLCDLVRLFKIFGF